MKNKTYKSSVTLGVTALSLIAIGLSGIAAAAGISYFGAESSAITPPAVDPSSVTPIVEVPTTTNSPFTPPPQTAVGAYYAYYTCLYVGVTCLVVAGGLILYAFITSDPAVQQVAPAVQQVAPAVQQVAPAVQQVAPAVQQVAPALTVTAMETGAKLSESAVQGIAKQVAMIPKTIMDSFNTVFPLCQDGTVAYPNNFGSQGYKMAAECYKRLCSAVAHFVAERGLSPIVEQIARVSWAKNALESWSENPTLLNKDLLFKTINYDRIKPEVVVKTYTVVLDFIRGYARVAYAVFSKNN